MRRTQLAQGIIPWHMRTSEEGKAATHKKGQKRKVKALWGTLETYCLASCIFLESFTWLQTDRWLGELGKSPHKLDWAGVGTGGEKEALSWKVWVRLIALFALEHNQPKGAMLAVGFLRMGNQGFSFPGIGISRSDNSSEGLLRDRLMSCLRRPCVRKMCIPRTAFLKVKLQDFFLYFSF